MLNHIKKDITKAVGIFGKFDFNLESVYSKVSEVLLHILSTLDKEDEHSRLMNILQVSDDKEIYKAIDKFKEQLMCLL